MCHGPLEGWGWGRGWVGWDGISGGGECWGRAATSWGEDKAGWRGHLTKEKTIGYTKHTQDTHFTFKVRSEA